MMATYIICAYIICAPLVKAWKLMNNDGYLYYLLNILPIAYFCQCTFDSLKFRKFHDCLNSMPVKVKGSLLEISMSRVWSRCWLQVWISRNVSRFINSGIWGHQSFEMIKSLYICELSNCYIEIVNFECQTVLNDTSMGYLALPGMIQMRF